MSSDYGSGGNPGGQDPNQAYQPQGNYPPQNYPPQGNYPPQNYQPQGNYPPQGYQPQGDYPPAYQQPPASPEDYARYQQGYGAPPPPVAPARRGRGPLPFIVTIVVIAALAVGGYFLWQNVGKPLIAGVAYDKLLPSTTMTYFSYNASPSADQQANWTKIHDAFTSQPGVQDKLNQLGQQMGMAPMMLNTFTQQCGQSNASSASNSGSILSNLGGFLSGNVTLAYMQPTDAEIRQVVKDAIQSGGMSSMSSMGMAGSGLGSGLGGATPPQSSSNAQDMQKLACEATGLFENHLVAVVELDVNPLDKNSIIAKLQDKTSDANKSSLTKDETYNGTDIYKIDLGSSSATFYGLLIGKEAVVASNKDALKSVVDAYKDGSKSLSSNASYTAALAKLPTDRSMTMFLDSSKFAGTISTVIDEASKDGASMSSLNSVKSMYDQMKGQNSVSVVSVAARPNGVQIDSAGSTGNSGLAFAAPLLSDRDFVKRMPDGAWGFIASADLKGLVNQVFTYIDKQKSYFQSLGLGNMDTTQLKQQFKQASGLDLDNDILSWMGGEWGFYLQPNDGDMKNAPNLVFAINVKDSKDKATAAIQKINQATKDKAGVSPTQVQVAGSTIYKIGSPDAQEINGDSVYYGVIGDYFYIANRQAAIESFNTGKGGMADSANYKGAMTNAISNNEGVAYINIQAIVQGYDKYINDQVQKNPTDSYYKGQLKSFEQDIKPFLNPFHSVGVTSDSANGIQHSVVFIDIEK